MFTQQQEPARKRSREDEYEDVSIGGSLGFTEHRSKRLQALPFRTSPTSKRLSFPNFPQSGTSNPAPAPHTITPADSDSEDANKTSTQPKSHFSPWSSPTVVMSQDPSPFGHAPEMVDRYPTADTDMDMDEPTEESGEDSMMNSFNAHHLGPGNSQPDPIQSGNITGRMPTPIHCTFAAQVRGNNWSGAAGHVLSSGAHNQPTADRSVPRSLDNATVTDWNSVQNRRLPSPISESGGEESGMSSDSSPRMGYATQHPGMPPRAASAMDLPRGDDNTMDIEQATPSPKRGHTRSRHTLNNWTLQPGMKRSFSIGYRADCEKCRQKVPGHFNHIILS